MNPDFNTEVANMATKAILVMAYPTDLDMMGTRPEEVDAFVEYYTALGDLGFFYHCKYHHPTIPEHNGVFAHLSIPGIPELVKANLKKHFNFSKQNDTLVNRV